VTKSKSTPPTCQVTKSTLPSHKVHIAKSPSPHCQVTKFTLASHWEQFQSLNHEFYFFFVSNLSEWRGEIESPSTFFFYKSIFWPWAIYVHGWKMILMDESNPIDWMNFICESCSKCNGIDLDARTMTQQDETFIIF
jgi:hypothetical protein